MNNKVKRVKISLDLAIKQDNNKCRLESLKAHLFIDEVLIVLTEAI